MFYHHQYFCLVLGLVWWSWWTRWISMVVWKPAVPATISTTVTLTFSDCFINLLRHKIIPTFTSFLYYCVLTCHQWRSHVTTRLTGDVSLPLCNQTVWCPITHHSTPITASNQPELHPPPHHHTESFIILKLLFFLRLMPLLPLHTYTLS